MVANPAEQFVYEICTNSFLSLWSYANPKGPKGQSELCDILVVCDPNVIIFSVKNIVFQEHPSYKIAVERWLDRAIRASTKQIYGAERWLASASQVTKCDGTPGLFLPKKEIRNVHRVAVALGGHEKAPLFFGDLGKGFIHVFDETSFGIVLKELDTISDFTGYLTAKEKLYRSGKELWFGSGEEELLAMYLCYGPAFLDSEMEEADEVFLDDTLWKGHTESAEYAAKKQADKISYMWDDLIEHLARFVVRDSGGFGKSLNKAEIAVRTMAKEDRFCRRCLAKALDSFLAGTRRPSGRLRSRLVTSYSGVTYVFLHLRESQAAKLGLDELATRCFIALDLVPASSTVVGIQFVTNNTSTGLDVQAMYFHAETLSAAERKRIRIAKKELGYFSKPVKSRIHEDEYPTDKG